MAKKLCVVCRDEKDLNDFGLRPESRDGHKSRCKNCEVRQQKARGRKLKDPKLIARQQKNARLLREFGISIDEYEKMYADQNGQCAICKKVAAVLDIDHCHNSLVVRGLLCNQCNQGIGLLQHDVEVLKRAIEYLQQEREPVDLYKIFLMTGR